MTNTEQLLASLEWHQQYEYQHMDFYVGRFTGNGPAVVAAMRRRGYRVEKLSPGRYRVHAKEQQA